METSLGAAMLLRPLLPRPFPPGSGESVNLGKDVLVFCLFLCLVVVFAFVFILVCDPWERKCSVWAQDVILTKSDKAKLSDLKAWFFCFCLHPCLCLWPVRKKVLNMGRGCDFDKIRWSQVVWFESLVLLKRQTRSWSIEFRYVNCGLGGCTNTREKRCEKETFHSAQSYFLQTTTSLIFLSRKYMNEGKIIQQTLKDIERNWWR